MHLILFGFGVVAVVAGIVMIGFGIQYNEFGTGNTFLAAGTTAAIGGLILVGLAAALRELVRIANAVAPATPPLARAAATPKGEAQPPAGGRIEPAPVAPGLATPAEAQLEPPPMEAAPPVAPPEPAPQPERAPTRTRATSPTAGAEPRQSSAEIPVVLSPRERGFDTVWPSDQVGEGADRGRPSASPAPSSGDEVAIRAARSPQAVTILKSGVIDGMAYTLYSDGSIEAELPQGIMRFATIDELRVHLAKS
jgi:hypothetical protein